VDRTDWMLKPIIFHCLKKRLGSSTSRPFCHLLPEAEATDAFMQDWSRYVGFAPPLWCLILRVLAKLQAERETIDSAYYPSVGNTSMFPYIDGDVGGYSCLTTRGSSHADSPSMPPSASHLEGLMHRLTSKKNSGPAVDLITSSWREKTNSYYESEIVNRYDISLFDRSFPYIELFNREVSCWFGLQVFELLSLSIVIGSSI